MPTPSGGSPTMVSSVPTKWKDETMIWFIIGYVAGLATIPLTVAGIGLLLDRNLDDW